MAALRFISVTLAVSAYVLSSGHFIGLSQEASTPSPSSREVKLILTITDPPGRYVDGLKKEKVTVFDNDVPQDLMRFESSNIPFSIGLLFNVSKARYAEVLKHTARPLLTVYEWEQGAKQGVNNYFIMGFNNGEFLAAEWTTLTHNLSSGFDKLASIKPSKTATLYDALEAGFRKIETGTHFKRAIILISDSRETGRGPKREMFMDALRRSNVLLYIIHVEHDSSFDSSAFQRAELRPLCSVTGGFAESVQNVAEIEDFLEKIKLELNHQYLVGFIPKGTSSTEREWHRLRFDVKPLLLKQPSAEKSKKVELSARGREGYYPRTEK